MTKILIQNIFRDFQNDNYLSLSCKPSGLINIGDYIILKENIKVEIMNIEEGLYGILSLSVKKESLASPDINYDFLHNKEFLIQKIT
ncbi:hypothetical protein D1631_08980 [Chryseobacterium nematophagum]|uniref:Uncharacterized protein n=1 Tax=Chryseobacterium nematophagum TaxID=2305228 RepID=A0A3M7TGL0_9FLAO|nr:hypothetical protein [Chryseobacterium nematophagum]RNA62057.1 hypothetical protein D1631_08980 [Chryseobacterium nematophagum]